MIGIILGLFIVAIPVSIAVPIVLTVKKTVKNQEITGTPAILFFKKGKLVGQILGNVDDLANKVQKGVKAIWNTANEGGDAAKSNLQTINWTNQAMNDAQIKSKIDNKKNFVLFFGNSQCGACKKARDKLDNANELKKTIAKAQAKNNNEAVFYWYYGSAPTRSQAVKNVIKKLNEVIKDGIGQKMEEPFNSFNT